jgi:adenine deaminase
LRALTLDAAEILGVADRMGSIEEGKIANLVVTDGDFFNKKSKVKMVFVDGKRFEVHEAPKEETPPAKPAVTPAKAGKMPAKPEPNTSVKPGQKIPSSPVTPEAKAPPKPPEGPAARGNNPAAISSAKKTAEVSR